LFYQPFWCRAPIDRCNTTTRRSQIFF
jgi:hypothetical protein